MPIFPQEAELNPIEKPEPTVVQEAEIDGEDVEIAQDAELAPAEG